jgi:uncharacterized cupin superfamily protein
MSLDPWSSRSSRPCLPDELAYSAAHSQPGGNVVTKPILNIDEVEFRPRSAAVPDDAAERFEASFARVGSLIGATQLGYNITAVPPGKSAFPYHSHRVNEEMFFVLQGMGELRIGADRYRLRAGDIVACPAGGPECAHQISNSGEEELRYLALSTLRAPEIWEYPNSGKFGVIAEYGSPGQAQSAPFFHFLRVADSVDYWDGE